MNRLDQCPVKDNAPETVATLGRQPYASPMLTRHGNVSDLTNKRMGTGDGNPSAKGATGGG